MFVIFALQILIFPLCRVYLELYRNFRFYKIKNIKYKTIDVDHVNECVPRWEVFIDDFYFNLNKNIINTC